MGLLKSTTYIQLKKIRALLLEQTANSIDSIEVITARH